MANAIYIAYANGQRKNLDKAPGLVEVQKIVGGYVELVHMHGYTLLVNEDARVDGKTRLINSVASWIYGAEILGDVVVFEPDAKKGVWQ